MINVLEKIKNFSVKLLSTLFSPYFQLHKMFCWSFSDHIVNPLPPPPCNILCEDCIFGMSGVLFLKSQWLLKKKKINVHYVFYDIFT